jgi:branched-chain amino acid transport system substrate-binding protein
VAAALGALTVTLAGCSVIEDQPALAPVRIAADLELTGAGSALGTVYRNALELRVEQVNQLGLLGDRRLELDIHDNRSDPVTAASNIAQLASDPGVTAIITGACGECLAASVDTINERGVPTIALAASTPIAAPVEPYVFKVGPNPDHTATELARALDAAGVGTVGLITTTDQYGEGGLAEMDDADARAEFQIVVHEPVGAESDLAAVAGRIASFQNPPDPTAPPPDPTAEPQVGPDAVVLWAYSGLAGEIAASLRAAGYSNPLFLDAMAAGDLFLTGVDRDALTGATMVFTETMVMDEVVATSPAKAARKTWFRDYTARFGTYHAFSSFAADAIALVVDAVNRSGGTTRVLLRDTIEVTQLDGLSGPLRLTPSQHSGLMPQALTLLTVRGDRWRLGG